MPLNEQALEPKHDTHARGLERMRGSLEDPSIVTLVVLLTLNAGWLDALAFLSLGRVFASFLSGNFVFIGLGLAQGDTGLLVRCLATVSAALGGSAFAWLSLRRMLTQRPDSTWRTAFVPLLFAEAIPLLGLAAIWLAPGDLRHQSAIPILLLALAGGAMGIQGALVTALELPGIVANALTGTVIHIGQRIAERLDGAHPKSREWRRRTAFVLLLPLLYVGSALVVTQIGGSAFSIVLPLLIVAAAIVTVHRSSAKRSGKPAAVDRPLLRPW